MSTLAPDRAGGNSLAYVYDRQQCLGHVLARGKTGFEGQKTQNQASTAFSETVSIRNTSPPASVASVAPKFPF
jgi:hypothetical protein